MAVPSLLPEAIHPGFTLKTKLEQSGMKQNELAVELAIAPSQLNEIIKSKKPITPELFILLSDVFTDTKPEYWAKLQYNYDIRSTAISDSYIKKKENIDKWNIIKKLVPINYFRKIDQVQGDLSRDIDHLLKILGFDSVSELEAGLLRTSCLSTHYKKSTKLSECVPHVNSWVKYVKHVSEKQKVSLFNIEKQDDLVIELQRLMLTINENKNVDNDVTRLLNSYGIKFVLQSKPDHVPLDGAALMHKGAPVIALTKRHKRFDNYIFTLYHELGHVVKHLNERNIDFVDNTFDENEKANSIDFEKEANDFATQCIVPDEDWKTFLSNSQFDDRSIFLFAKKVKSHPVSIWGMLCHEGKVKFNSPTQIRHLNKID
jgi:HTH-type transcriptional regulator/antitoxin HigA